MSVDTLSEGPGTINLTQTHSGRDIPLENPDLVSSASWDIVIRVSAGATPMG